MKTPHNNANNEAIQSTRKRKTGMAIENGQQLRPETELLNKQSKMQSA